MAHNSPTALKPVTMRKAGMYVPRTSWMAPAILATHCWKEHPIGVVCNAAFGEIDQRGPAKRLPSVEVSIRHGVRGVPVHARS